MFQPKNPSIFCGNRSSNDRHQTTLLNALSHHVTGLFSGRTPRGPIPTPASTAALAAAQEGRIDIAMPDPTAEDRARDTWQAHGLKRARQEDWDKIAGLMRLADEGRKLTPGGMSVADLIAYGARSDVVGAVEHALMEGDLRCTAPLLAGIEALESVLSDAPSEPMIAVVVALAHLDIAWAWRGNGPAETLSPSAQEAFAAHIDRARDILSPFCDTQNHSPLFLSARCALMRGGDASAKQIADMFETLIDLNPMDTRQIRALGTALLPQWNGDHDRLELEARRTAARLSPVWGAGGYTWVMMDAIVADQTACAALDVGYFLDGMRDILALRPDQFTVNLLAAYTSVTMAAETGQAEADSIRTHIRGARGWIVCDYMTELHPLIWAHAAHGFDNALRVRGLDAFTRKGVAEARRVLSHVFLPELTRGARVVFTENGPTVEPG